MTDAPMPSPRRLRQVSAAMLLVTFGLGLVGGVGLAPLLRSPPGRLPPSFEPLHLSPAQRGRIEAIVDSHGPEVDAAPGEARPRLRAVQERVALEIEAELDAAQREVFRRERASHSPPLPR
jgi:hypothetical protein